MTKLNQNNTNLMKKKFTLFLASLLLCLSAHAEFVPGKMYALKESTTGLYLDIQTLGIDEPNAGVTTNNISRYPHW